MALYPEGTAPLPLDDVQRAANKANELSRQTLGLGGSTVLSGTGTASDGPFVAIQILADTGISAITAPGITGSASLVTTLAAGTIVYGDIRSVTITSGLLIAYKAG
jgi:hypothetical protein